MDGLKSFCADNHMIVNETKSKVLCFDKQTELNVYFNDKKIEQVSRYKYLGNIVKCISTQQQDIFGENYTCVIKPGKRHLVYAGKRALLAFCRHLSCSTHLMHW